MTTSKALPDLETSLAEITQLIQQMEKGELTLDQSLHHFERGITLITHSQKILEKAEQKVEMLIQHNQKEELKPYNEEKENDINP